MRRLVRVNKLGLVIPPQRLDCLGEACPVARKTGRCFVDEHHLYFPRADFQTDELSDAFQSDPFNRIRLPRCQHNSAAKTAVHSQYKRAPKPRAEIMERFLEESALLRELGVVSVMSSGLLESIQDEHAPVSTIQRREEHWYAAQTRLDSLALKVREECEVLLPFLQRRGEQLPYELGKLSLPGLVWQS